MEKIDYKEIPFGLALSHAAMDPASVPDFLNPGAFDAVEIPAECFLHDDYSFRRRLANCKFKIVRAGHLMAPDLARNIPFLAENYRRDFADQAGEMIRTLAAHGVSLTLTDVNDKSFAVRLIPTTRRETNLDGLKPGELVNIETDLVGKYVCEQLRFMDGAPRGGRKLSMDDLTEAGF